MLTNVVIVVGALCFIGLVLWLFQSDTDDRM